MGGPPNPGEDQDPPGSGDSPAEAPGSAGDSDALLRRFANGDESALETLLEFESPRLLHRIRRRLPPALRRRVGESDILQLTTMDLLTVRERFENRGMAAFRGLLDTIADINVARVLERETAQRRSIEKERPLARPGSETPGRLLEELAESGPSPSSPMHLQERSETLAECFALLSQSDREIIRWIDYEELSYPEVAEKLGVEAATLRRRHSRAIARLRELLKHR